jgi:hypothetical protein
MGHRQMWMLKAALKDLDEKEGVAMKEGSYGDSLPDDLYNLKLDYNCIVCPGGHQFFDNEASPEMVAITYFSIHSLVTQTAQLTPVSATYDFLAYAGLMHLVEQDWTQMRII